MNTTTTTATTTDPAVTLPMPDAPAAPRNRLLIWYHESDRQLAIALDPHIQLLLWRMRQRVRLHYYCYPTYEPDPTRVPERTTSKETAAAAEVDTPERHYTYAVQSFARAALFVPYLSPAFLLRFVRDDERDPQLHEALLQPDLTILPVSLAPYVGISSTCLERPLVAYPQGYERQEAAARVVASIEAALRTQGYFEANGDPTEEVHPLFARLEAPRSTEAPRPRRFFLF